MRQVSHLHSRPRRAKKRRKNLCFFARACEPQQHTLPVAGRCLKSRPNSCWRPNSRPNSCWGPNSRPNKEWSNWWHRSKANRPQQASQTEGSVRSARRSLHPAVLGISERPVPAGLGFASSSPIQNRTFGPNSAIAQSDPIYHAVCP